MDNNKLLLKLNHKNNKVKKEKVHLKLVVTFHVDEAVVEDAVVVEVVVAAVEEEEVEDIITLTDPLAHKLSQPLLYL